MSEGTNDWSFLQAASCTLMPVPMYPDSFSYIIITWTRIPLNHNHSQVVTLLKVCKGLSHKSDIWWMMFVLLQKGWHQFTGITLVTGIIVFANVLWKGSEMPWRVHCCPKNELNCFTAHLPWLLSTIVWEPIWVWKAGVCFLWKRLGSLPVCLLLCAGFETAAPTRLSLPGKYRHLRKLLFALQKFTVNLRWTEM